jgi:hypothetical protein
MHGARRAAGCLRSLLLLLLLLLLPIMAMVTSPPIRQAPAGGCKRWLTACTNAEVLHVLKVMLQAALCWVLTEPDQLSALSGPMINNELRQSWAGRTLCHPVPL